VPPTHALLRAIAAEGVVPAPRALALLEREKVVALLEAGLLAQRAGEGVIFRARHGESFVRAELKAAVAPVAL
jgi:phosphopantothenate synthetase